MSCRLVASVVVLGALVGCRGPVVMHAPDDAANDAAVPRDVAEPPDALDAPRIDASLIDGSSLEIPDLQFVTEEMINTVVVTNDNFGADSCEVMEGCVAGGGARQLLRFDTVTANRGTGDLVVGVPPPAGESNAIFQWSSCHGHHHVANYTRYELVNNDGVVMTGRKQAFCLEDGEQVVPGVPATGYSCTNQGISHGWADVYTRYLPCQWIDVTDIAHGSYTLRIILNPAHALPESDYSNNVLTIPVSI